jgi:hypothetical protein
VTLVPFFESQTSTTVFAPLELVNCAANSIKYVPALDMVICELDAIETPLAATVVFNVIALAVLATGLVCVAVE